ncbi:protein MENT-like [Microtus oregoni]|uniref:protein MENT-like n=1 Tax=Microtus oregoni TaxID=111838 RepID=UPI001BB0FA95|nr:protein MENT-like [Microtus oregoni]
MVPAACMLLWALLLSLGLRAAGAQDQTSNPTSMPRISVRFGPARSRRSTSVTIRNSVHRKVKVTLEDDNDALATADRLAAPAAAELLSTVSGISRSSASNFNEYDGSLEEGAVIDAKKNTYPATLTSTSSTMSVSTAPGRFVANSQEREIRMTTTDLPPLSSKPVDLTSETLESTLHQWSTPGSTPTPWRKASPTAMPSPEDLRVMLMPWGPWHCHCKSGTMSRSRAGKLHGISGRLRIGALNELRTEHRPCTYQQCPCNKLLEECPLDSSLCPDSGCSSPTTGMSTTSPQAPVHLRRRPILPPTSPSPSPALAFWKRVRINLEDIWNSLSSVFTEMQPLTLFASPHCGRPSCRDQTQRHIEHVCHRNLSPCEHKQYI